MPAVTKYAAHDAASVDEDEGGRMKDADVGVKEDEVMARYDDDAASQLTGASALTMTTMQITTACTLESKGHMVRGARFKSNNQVAESYLAPVLFPALHLCSHRRPLPVDVCNRSLSIISAQDEDTFRAAAGEGSLARVKKAVEIHKLNPNCKDVSL